MPPRKAAGPAHRVNDGEALKIVRNSERDERSFGLPQVPAQAIRAELRGSNEASALGLTLRSHAPVLALCRLLITAGHDPATPLEAYRADTLLAFVFARLAKQPCSPSKPRETVARSSHWIAARKVLQAHRFAKAGRPVPPRRKTSRHQTIREWHQNRKVPSTRREHARARLPDWDDNQ